MADQPTNQNDVSLREMIEMMSSRADDETFRWFTVDASRTVRVTIGHIRKVLGLDLEGRVRQASKEGTAGLIPKHPFHGEAVYEWCSVCEWCGFVEDTVIEQERIHAEPV